jgi:hypothetical protein
MGLAAFNRMRRQQAEAKEKLEKKEDNKNGSSENEEEKRIKLIARAEELEIKGVLVNFKTETLEKKIAEAESKLEA